METQWLPVSLVVWITALAGALDARQQVRFVALCTGLLFARGRRTVASWLRLWRIGQFGVSSSLLLPLHQVGKLDSWEDFQDRQAMTLFTTRSTAGTTEPMSSAPTANGICSLAISPAPRHGTVSRSSATA